jgi:uncharacterized metal-binding protein (TIGR02443 family)
MGDDYPREGEDLGEKECPHCEATATAYLLWLSEEENVSIINCTECDFEIESESNLAAQDRREFIREQVEEGMDHDFHGAFDRD